MTSTQQSMMSITHADYLKSKMVFRFLSSNSNKVNCWTGKDILSLNLDPLLLLTNTLNN